MSGYEDAPATKMLATHCACCSRSLVDAKSVEIGIGPICRKKHGYDAILDLDEETRIKANKLVYQVARKRDGQTVLECCQKLFELGCTKLVIAILRRVATIQIGVTDDGHPHGPGRLAVKTPYSEAIVGAFRRIRGRRWDKEHKVNTFPPEARKALHGTLMQHFPGEPGIGPKGPFVLGDASPEAVAFKATLH